MKLTQDYYVHDKGCLECPKNINNQKSKLLNFWNMEYKMKN